MINLHLQHGHSKQSLRRQTETSMRVLEFRRSLIFSMEIQNIVTSSDKGVSLLGPEFRSFPQLDFSCVDPESWRIG